MQSSSPQLADPPTVLVDLPEDKQLVVVERVETRGPSVGVLCYFLDEPLLLLGRNGSQVEILRELLVARQQIDDGVFIGLIFEYSEEGAVVGHRDA